jgi:hypothetical protein
VGNNHGHWLGRSCDCSVPRYSNCGAQRRDHLYDDGSPVFGRIYWEMYSRVEHASRSTITVVIRDGSGVVPLSHLFGGTGQTNEHAGGTHSSGMSPGGMSGAWGSCVGTRET